MAFLNPTAFYLIGTIPIVIALHFLKLRRQRFVVPSMLLWWESAEDQKANVPFQRLRNLLLPFLQFLFLLVIIISVARPALRIPGIIHGKIIFVVDNSASMLSKEMGTTRLELAKQKVLKHINQVSASGGMMIMATHAPKPYILQAFTTDKDKLRAAVENIAPTHVASRLTSVFDHATHYVDSLQDQIYFITDSFENIPVCPPTTSVPVNKIAVGGQADNIGIVHLGVEKIADQYTILARIQNWTETTNEINIRLELNGSIAIAEKPVIIPSGEVKSALFSIGAEGVEGKAIRLHLFDVADNFELDNEAWGLLKKARKLNILIVSDTNQRPLIQMLRNYGDNVTLTKVSKDEYIGVVNADVVIFEGGVPSGYDFLNSRESIILINAHTELRFGTTTTVEMITTPVSVIKENVTHPIMQNISLMGLQIKGSVSRDLPTWGDSLVETEKGPLIWFGTHAGRHHLVFEFDPFNPEISRFSFFIPDAPLLFYQSLEWFEANAVPIQSLTPQKDSSEQIFRTGEQLTIEIPSVEESTIKVKKPDGKIIELNNEVFTETDQIGVYSVYADDSLFDQFAVNLLDATESALLPATTTFNSENQVGEKELLQPLTREIWQWTALFAVFLLLCEWWFYHRT